MHLPSFQPFIIVAKFLFTPTTSRREVLPLSAALTFIELILNLLGYVVIFISTGRAAKSLRNATSIISSLSGVST